MRASLLALFLGILALGPTLLPGRGLLPQDIRLFEPYASTLDAEERAALADASVPHRRDKLLQFLPFDHAVGKAWRRSEVPLWSSEIFCGVPLLAQMTSRALYPTALAFAFLPPQTVYAWTYLAHWVLAGFFAHRIVRRLGGTPAGGYLAVAATILSGYALAHVHHPMIYFAAVWCLPAIDATLVLLRAGDGTRPAASLRAAILLALSVMLSWFAGFSQASVLLCYLVVFLTLTYVGWEAYARRRFAWRRGLRVAVPLAIGILLALPQLLPTLEASQISSRRPGTPEELERAALPPSQLLEFVLPGQLSPEGDIVIDGEGPKPSYVGMWLTPKDRMPELSGSRYNFTETAITVGIWPLLLALASFAGFFRRRVDAAALADDATLERHGSLHGRGGNLENGTPVDRRGLSFLWGTVLFGLAAALALPLVFAVTLRLPGFAVGDLKRLLWLPSLALPLLAGLGFTTLRRPLTRIPWAVIGLAFLAFSIVLWNTSNERFEGFFADRYEEKFGDPAIKQGFLAIANEVETTWNREHLAAGFLRLGLALLAGVALTCFARTRSIAWVVATAIELLPIAWNVTPAPPLEPFDRTLPLATARASEGAPPPRLLRVEPGAPSVASVDVLPANLGVLWGAAEVTGYVPLPAKRSEAFFEGIEPGSTSRGAGLSALREFESLRSPWLPLLAPDTLALQGEPVAVRGWNVAERIGDVTFLRPEVPFPSARLYFEHRVIESLAKAEAQIGLPSDHPEFVDPERTLLLESEPERVATPGATGIVHEVTYANDVIRVRYEASGDAHLLVSEAWAPGWRVFVDGEDVQLETVPGQVMFQAVAVPAGEHVVELRYAPAPFRLGLLVAAFTLLLALVAACSGVLRPGSKRRHEPTKRSSPPPETVR